MAKRGAPARKPRKHGPEAQTVAIEGDWKDAIAKAMRKPRPPSGWPKPPKKQPTKK
jgi:hypothetical protein